MILNRGVKKVASIVLVVVMKNVASPSKESVAG
jgi:hypothetical protein